MSVHLPIKSTLDVNGFGSHTSHIISLLREGKDDSVETLLLSLYYNKGSHHVRDNLLSFMQGLITTAHLYYYLLFKERVYRVLSDDSIDPSTASWSRLSGRQWLSCPRIKRTAPPEYLTYYYQKLQTCTLYRCGINGVPQQSFGGLPLAQCQATAQATRLIPDLQYKVLSYNLDLTLHLPPLDQSRVLKEVIGYTLPLHNVARTLQALKEGNWKILRDMEDLKAYYSTKYSPADYCLRDIAWELDLCPDVINYQALRPRFVRAVKQYQKTGILYELRYTILSLFYRNLSYPADVDVEDLHLGEIDAVETLNIELITDMIEGRLNKKLTLV